MMRSEATACNEIRTQPARWTPRGTLLIAFARLSAGLLGLPAFGQEHDSASVPPPITVGGFVDSYFSVNVDRPSTHINELRNFDVTENQLVVSEAEISVSRPPAPVGFRLELDLGPANTIVQSGATGSLANVGQAYITCTIPVGAGLTVDAGKFVTHMGLEVIKAKDDYNYSRSLLFSLSIPYYHMGARASYPVTPALTLSAFVYDSYNGPTVNSAKSFGFQGIFTPAPSLSITGNWLGGPALPDSVSKRFRNVGELIISYQVSAPLTLALDGVYGQENLPAGVNLWKGLAAYARCTLSDLSAVSLRGEIYSDPEGYTTGAPQDLREITLTCEFKPVPSLILRAEYRYDFAGAPMFDGQGGPLTRRTQATVGFGAVAVF